MTRRREKTRTARERDLMELLAYRKRLEERLADAVVTLLSRADARTLAALGVIVEFVARRTARRRR